MLDFNSVPPVANATGGDLNQQRDAIRADLLARLASVLMTLLPAGKKRGQKYLVGDVLGSPGDSLEVSLKGETAGLWHDHATGEGGDIFDLIAAHHGLDTQADFARVLEIAGQLVGRATSHPPKRKKVEAPVDELGPATAKWDYLDAAGNLIACVYRYDPAPGRKEFRPWDAKRRKMAPPGPRPLYNQPGIVCAEQVILVEGEKCAQALIEAGTPATTAMHGANAPVDKTDWSPLAGKAVLIWPDRDKPGFGYAEAASQAVLMAGATSCAILLPPDAKPEGWDAADALAEDFDVAGFIATGPRITVQPLGDEPDLPEYDGQADHDSDATVWGTEDALAVSFTRRYQRDWRYVAMWGKWLMWDGRRWRTEETLAASDLIRQVCRHAAVRADSSKVAAKLAASSTVSGVERLARSDRRHAATSDEWDADIWLLNTPGGVVDLRTGRMRAHDRADRMTKIATATPKGSSPLWLDFIDQITQGDREYADYLQRFAGYCLTGSTQEHALFFLYGKARAERKPRLGEELIRPDGSVIRYVREEDDDQKPVDHYRTVDTLALMLRNGSITGAMHDAGQQFSQDFARAFASGVANSRLDGLPCGTAPGEMLIERNASAARAVRDALEAVGGSGSPAGSALWYVAGLQMSIRDWAQREGWNGRRQDRDEAKGYLVAALGVLARYYGYERSGPPQHRRRPESTSPSV